MTSFDPAALSAVRSCWPSGVADDWLPALSVEGLVSVIVPTFNREKLIARALDSVAAQTYRPVELIVVDDGSQDRTAAVAREWIAANERQDFSCRLIVQANAGPAAARNAGIQASSGQYIQYLDSDDFLHPQKLALHVILLRDNPQFGYVWSPHVQFYDEPKSGFMKCYDLDQLKIIAKKIYSVTIFSTTGTLLGGLYRRALHAFAGPLNPNLTVAEDIEFAIRMTALRPNVIYTPEPMVFIGNDATTRTDHTFATEGGVAAGLNALSMCEHILHAVSDPTGSAARKSVAVFYSWIMFSAVRLRMPHAVVAALAGQRRNRRGLAFMARLALFEAIWRAGAPGVALWLTRNYACWASGS
jgi:cellulose synthase/poly-beta-1,6-N-acetylglucosamine synthase-like glycosyltransferase